MKLLSPDPYHTESVRAFLVRPGDYVTGFDIKRFGSLGDKIAATLLVVVQESEFHDARIVFRVAKAIQLAFEHARTENHRDYIPFLSYCLLNKLLQQSDTEAVRTELLRTIAILDAIVEVKQAETDAGEFTGHSPL